jgi:phosphoglycerate dehydrogenase-like enzyme
VTDSRRLMLVDLRSTAEAFVIPERVAQAIHDATPSDWRVHIMESTTDSFGDGAQAPSEEALRWIPEAEVYVGFGMPRPLFLAGPKLKWVHTGTAGVASLLFDEMHARDVALTNAAGVYGPTIAEHTLAGVLHFLRAFDLAAQLRVEKRFDQSAFAHPSAAVREIDELSVLVIGAGGLGSEIATRFSALGARVIGVRRRPGLGVPAGFSEVHGLSELDGLLPNADVVVLATPLTEETRQLLHADRLALLHPGTILVNVARGALVDEEALIQALKSGRVRGAVLDVFAKEPLAAESPLWHLPNVLWTPHVSGVSPRRFWDRLQALILDNWERYRTGTPLRNLVDKRAGY